MKYRISNIIETLKKAPLPEYKGQVLKLPIRVETWEVRFAFEGGEAINKNTSMKTIVLKAERYGSQGDKWLEWVYEI